MKKKAIILSAFTIIMCFQNAFAQFCIVQDTDEYVNVRGEHNKIINKVPVGTIVWGAMPDFEWSDAFNSLYVGYSKGDKIYFGNIHQSKLKDISSLTKLQKKENKNLITFKQDSTVITIKVKVHAPPYSWWIICENINVRINENEFSLPKSSYSDLKNIDSNYYFRVYYDKATQSFYIMATGGDGSEGYVVMWEIRKWKYIDRHICSIVPDDYIPYIPQKGILKKNVYRSIGQRELP